MSDYIEEIKRKEEEHKINLESDIMTLLSEGRDIHDIKAITGAEIDHIKQVIELRSLWMI